MPCRCTDVKIQTIQKEVTFPLNKLLAARRGLECEIEAVRKCYKQTTRVYLSVSKGCIHFNFEA